ncbi:MAG: hypothetical protein QOD30_2226 [Actinomycetota bacterium]|nr:hypothetical protein [Actinomycetota bacterium]
MQSWLVRVAWLALPLTVGSVMAGALDDRSTAVQLTLPALLWGCWAIVLVGLLVPRPAALVGLRAAAAALVPLVVWAADSSGDWSIAGVHTLVLLALALAPTTGEWLVNGTSYGYERRYLLRVPAPLLLGPIELAALALPASVVTGPLLLASRQWVAGTVAVAVGAPLAVVLARAMHAMTLRWGVLVPAGFVLKDHLSMLDPVLFRRAEIELLAAADEGTDAMDLTANAIGVPLELRFTEPQHIDRLQLGRGTPAGYEVQRLLFTPTRRAALLADAGERRIRVATPPPKTTSPS